MQAVLDGKTLITYQNWNDNVYNSEDIMSIPTFLNRPAVVENEVEMLLAA